MADLCVLHVGVGQGLRRGTEGVVEGVVVGIADPGGRIPLGRMGEGADIGAAVAYLASREAGYVTGQTLHVNGGMAMY